MMSQMKSDSKRLNVYIDSFLADSLSDYCKERGLTKSAAAERIIREYLYKYFKGKDTTLCNEEYSDR